MSLEPRPIAPVPIPPGPGRARSAEPGFLDRVLERWGLVRPERTDREALDRLQTAYLTHVPFENATKMVKASRAGSPDGAMRGPVEFWDEHLKWGSGGTCFAATHAYQFLLRYLGFTSRTVFGHLPGQAPDAHVALLVESEAGPVLVDVGYALPAPLPLPERAAVRRSTPYYDLEIRRGPQDEYLVFSEDDRGQRFRYRFTPRPVADPAYLEAWRKTFRPEAPYMRRLALGRFQGETRYLYKDPTCVYEITRAGEAARPLTAPVTATLSEVFGVPKPLLDAALGVLKVPSD